MVTAKPIIVVLHATSKQGSSVIIALLETDKFAVKGITRDVNGDNAKKLAAKGAEMVQADTTDADQLRAAFEGAYGVFVVTTGLEVFQMNKELELGKMTADLAAAAGAKVFVFSMLEDCKKLSKGKYNVPPFQDKARVADYVTATHSSMIGIYPAVGGFYTNWADMSRPKMDEDGILVFATAGSGDVVTPWLNPYTAIGPVVAAAFLEPEKYQNAVIPIYDELLTPNHMVKTFTRVTGIKARYKQLTKADMEAAMPGPWADILWQAWKSCDEFGYYAPDRDMELVHKINPHPETWVDFLRKTGFDGTQSLQDIRSKYI